ncbi:MAG TPA: alkaline phosphatase family protein, partial [Acidobacteriota bacterium]|nr:alkaline phosphatase family protein [Acidobacteriota bacterium]
MFLIFAAGPAFVELAVYLTRPELFPAYLPLHKKLLSLPLVFVYYSFLPLIIAASLALIQRVLPNTKILLFLIALQFGLFYAISLSRLAPNESGFTLTRMFIFSISAAVAFACGWCLHKWPASNVRLWIAITIYSGIASLLLQHLFQIPFAFFVVLILYPLMILGLAYFPGKLLIGIVVFIGIFFFQTKTMLQPFAPPIKQTAYDRVILVGVDALSQDTIQQLRTAKKLSAIETLYAYGAHGRLRTLNVPFSPLVWNTIYTGVAPKHHGVTGFTYSRPLGAEPFLSLWLDNWTNSDWSHKSIRALQDIGLIKTVRPANSRSRLASPLWDLVNANGGSALVIGGWTTYPP